MKLLIIRFSSIGDIVLATPAIRCIKQQVAGAEVHFLSKASFKAVTEANPYIDKFFYYNNNLRDLIRQLKAEQYDYVVDLHKNLRSYRIRWALWTKTLSYRKLSIQKFLLTRFHIDLMPKRHIADRCVDAVKKLGVENDGYGMDYFIPRGVMVDAKRLPLSHSMGFISMVIGASYYTKKLPADRLRALCASIDYPIILIGGKEDAETGEAIASVDPTRVFNACGKFSLHESADLVRRSKLTVSHDTGLQYIACAFHKPVIAVWGGTSPLLDVEPYYGTKTPASPASMYKNFLVPGLRCQPCSNYGTNECPLGHFKCMKQQDIAAMAIAVQSYL